MLAWGLLATAVVAVVAVVAWGYARAQRIAMADHYKETFFRLAREYKSVGSEAGIQLVIGLAPHIDDAELARRLSREFPILQSLEERTPAKSTFDTSDQDRIYLTILLAAYFVALSFRDPKYGYKLRDVFFGPKIIAGHIYKEFMSWEFYNTVTNLADFILRRSLKPPLKS